MIRRPPRSTLSSSSAASDVYKRQRSDRSRVNGLSRRRDNPFHVVMWATKALDKVRRRTLEHAGDRDRNARWAVVKNPDDLTADQRQSLATIRTTNTALYRAYLLKEQLRAVFATKGRRGEQLLGGLW